MEKSVSVKVKSSSPSSSPTKSKSKSPMQSSFGSPSKTTTNSALKRFMRGSKYKALENDTGSIGSRGTDGNTPNNNQKNEKYRGGVCATSTSTSARSIIRNSSPVPVETSSNHIHNSAASIQGAYGNSNMNSSAHQSKFNANALREIYNGALESDMMSKVEQNIRSTSSPTITTMRMEDDNSDSEKMRTKSNHNALLKKRKSDEGGIHMNSPLPPSGRSSRSSSASSPTFTDRTTRSLWSSYDDHDHDDHDNDERRDRHVMYRENQKRVRESNSPYSLRIKKNESSSSTRQSMPPMETLELNHHVNTSSQSLDSSLSSSPSVSVMERDSLDEFYSGDDITNMDVDGKDFKYPLSIDNRRRSDTSSDTDANEVNDDDDLEYEDDDDNGDDNDDDDDISCASTVVNDLPPARLQKPPPGASKEEQDRFYWDLCYGNQDVAPGAGGGNTTPSVPIPTKSWSASRGPPSKSCLSAKKTPWTEIANSATKRIQMRKQLNHTSKGSTPSTVDRIGVNVNGSSRAKNSNANPSPIENKGVDVTTTHTPAYAGKYAAITQSASYQSDKKQVKFGQSSAAEFEASRPTHELTPLPAELAREEYKVDEEDVQSDEESTELHQETARNADMLATWEDDFDSLCDDWDEDNDEVLDPLVERRKSPRRASSTSRSDRRRKSRSERQSIGRDNRRSSTFFSKDGGSLLGPGDRDMEGPKEMSPERLQEDYSRNNGTKEAQSYRASIASKDSLQFSSPSTIGGSFRLSNSSSEVSKDTPTADVTSLSKLLRSVHSAGGASMERMAFNNRQDDNANELKPNQLDYRTSSPICNGLESPIQRNEIVLHELLHELKFRDPLNITGTSELLQALRTDFENHHLVSSLIAIEETGDLYETCLLDIVQALCDITQPTSKETPNTCRSAVSDVLNMSISLLEELNSIQDQIDNDDLQKIVEAMNIFCENDELEEIYAHFAAIAKSKWTEQEGDALMAATNWLQPLFQSSCEEEAKIRILQEHVGACKTTSNTKYTKKQLKRRFKEELRIMKNMDAAIEKEQARLEGMKSCLDSLVSKCDLEHLRSGDMLRFQLMKGLLPYDCHVEPPVSVTYFHLDNSRTVVSWESSPSPTGMGRTSLSTSGSFESSAAVIMTTPKTKRYKNRDPACLAQQYKEGFLPEGSIARKLYSRFLDDENMKRFISEQFKIEHEMGILTLSDAFQRLNLMALDVLALQKYYTCRLDTMSKRSREIILHVTISLGQLCSIGVKFTFDLKSQRSFLLFMPSDVFVESITGEPAVPVTSLLHIAQQSIKAESSTNAFVLKGMCAEIVDTIQGRNNMISM